jgi:hypothetical protein
MLQNLERGLVVEGRMFSDIVVIIHIAHGFIQQVFFTTDLESPGDIELFVISTVGTLQVGVFFTMPLVILDQSAAKTSDKLAQFLDLHPGLATEFFAIIDSEHDLVFDPM